MLLCVGWAVARIIMLSGAPDIDTRSPDIVAIGEQTIVQSSAGQSVRAIAAASPYLADRLAHIGLRKPRTGPQPDQNVTGPTIRLSERVAPGNFAEPRTPTAPAVKAPSAKAASAMFSAPPNPGAKRFADVYAYSFWRRSTKTGGLAAAGQYGGSQSGLIVNIPLRGIGAFDDGENLALMFRAVVTPDSRADREVAAGIRWRPASSLPVTVTAERRFRPVGPDRVAVYIAGGVDKIAFPAKFDLDGYAQGGVVSGKGARPFFDGSARLYRAIHKTDGFVAKAGAGAWAGGQRGASRLDVGPSIGVDAALADIRLRINADWRFRIAGNARPGNGPALTLSTGF